MKKSTPGPGDGANAHFVVEASVPSRGSEAESHILVVYDAKWVTLSLGEAQESGSEFEVSEEGDEPIPAEVGKFTGLILAVRCRDAKEGRTETDFRIYRIKDGRVTGRERSRSSLAAGELKDVMIP